MERLIHTLAELEAYAKEFVGTLAPKTDGATLVTLSGELGAGKTAFTQALAKALGVDAAVTSPTFVLEKVYALPPDTAGSFKHLIHIDAYRLKDGSELAALGFAEAMKDTENLIILEWPERVAEALPPAAYAFTLTPLSDGARRLAMLSA